VAGFPAGWLLYGVWMRVCLVTRIVPMHGIGGMQDHTVDLARGLVSAGHHVEVITGRHPDGLNEDLIDGIRYRYVDASTDDFTSRQWRERSHEEYVRANAARPFEVVHSEGSSALELVRRGTHRTTPFVVMFHGNFVGLAKANLQRQIRARRPLDVLREQRGLFHLARRHFAKGNWRVFRTCEAIVPAEQQLADTCLSHRLDPTRVHVVPYGIDVSAFRPRPPAEARAALGLPDGFLFVCAGRLSREKGTHHALQALALARDSLPDARVLVVGDGEERAPLERLARELGVTERVIFAGAQEPGRMPVYIAAANVFLFPTERDEATGLVLLQAMASGLPVIASRTGAIPEVINRAGDSGLLVPPGDPRALATAAIQLYGDEGLRRRLAKGALARVREAYTLERMVAATTDVYELAQQRLSRARAANEGTG
jgi:glycosyltransferase involved in cell wall biosynthesis